MNLSAQCPKRENPLRTRTCVNTRLKPQNQIPVATDMYSPYMSCMTCGVSGLIITENKERKNNVAFGFRALVKKPILSAWEIEYSYCVIPSLAPEDTLPGRAFNDFHPI